LTTDGLGPTTWTAYAINPTTMGGDGVDPAKFVVDRVDPSIEDEVGIIAWVNGGFMLFILDNNFIT